MFSWTELGAQHVGIVQSLIATCRLHHVDPYDYLVVSVKPAASFPRAFRSGEFLPSLIEHGRPGNGQGGNGALASA